MQRYKNLDGNSGVAAYEAAKTAITVEFNNGQAYLVRLCQRRPSQH